MTQIDAKTSGIENKTAEQKPQPKKPIKKFIISLLTIVLIIVMSIGASSYYYIAKLQTDTVSMNKQLEAQQLAIINLQEKIDTMQQLVVANKSKWQLEQIKYLIELAHIHLTVEHNLSFAIKLLTIAQQQAMQIEGNQIIAIRTAIQQDLAALESIKPVSTFDTIKQLDAIYAQVQKLPIISEKIDVDTQNTTTIHDAKQTQSLWQKLWSNSISKLQDVVIIRHRQEKIQPLLTNTQQKTLCSNIQFVFEQAKWAVLKRDQQFYIYSLQQLQKLISQYGSHNLIAAQPILQTLQELQHHNLYPTFPDVVQPLQLLLNDNTNLIG